MCSLQKLQDVFLKTFFVKPKQPNANPFSELVKFRFHQNFLCTKCIHHHSPIILSISLTCPPSLPHHIKYSFPHCNYTQQKKKNGDHCMNRTLPKFKLLKCANWWGCGNSWFNKRHTISACNVWIMSCIKQHCWNGMTVRISKMYIGFVISLKKSLIYRKFTQEMFRLKCTGTQTVIYFDLLKSIFLKHFRNRHLFLIW